MKLKSRLITWGKRYWLYGVLALVILGPLLSPGYVLTMDMVFVPHPPIPTDINASYPFYVLLHILSYVIPGDVLQKLLLAGILAGAGIGAHRLVRQLLPDATRYAVAAAGTFYMMSAFVYERLMMGQFAVIAGYAALPFFVVALLRFMQTPTWRQLWWVVAWVLIVATLSVHTLVPLALVSLLIVGVQWRQWKAMYKKILVGIGVVTVVSSYWLLPTLLGSNLTGAALRGSGDNDAFASQGGLFALLRLQGMWAEPYGLFYLPQDVGIVPGIWQTLIWAMVIVGFAVLWRRQRQIAVVSGLLIVISCVVALVGIGGGYREPHKIIVLVALCMAVLGASGIDYWLGRLRPGRAIIRPFMGIFACAVPILMGMVLLWGCWGQLQTSMYPAEWYALNQKLQTLPNDKPAVFVPWHLYQRYSFSARIVASPAATFFEGRRIIVSDDPEFANVQPLKRDTLTTSVDKLLKQKPHNLAAELHKIGVGYVILADEPNIEEYEYIRELSGLTQVFTQGSITLYRVEG